MVTLNYLVDRDVVTTVISTVGHSVNVDFRRVGCHEIEVRAIALFLSLEHECDLIVRRHYRLERKADAIIQEFMPYEISDHRSVV